MTKYDDLFDETAPDNSVFADKSALDPLADPDEIVARDAQERELATLLQGVEEGYLPTTVSIYGPPGTGKTLTTRRLCREFAARTDAVAVEYVNLKDCRTLFSAANEIHLELTGEKKGAYEGLDGVFEGIWTALAEYPEWTVLILDEIDHIQHDSNYDPSDFFYRLLRGEGKLKREIQLSVWLISNELLEVDLRLDSRVQSAMGGEEVFFPPYSAEELAAIVRPRLERAFREGALPDDVRTTAIDHAAMEWGDIRKTLTLFRQAGETANERGLNRVTEACLTEVTAQPEKDETITKLTALPERYLAVLTAIVSRSDGSGTIIQPVTTAQIDATLSGPGIREDYALGTRAIRDVVSDLETMGLVETWIESRGREGRVKQIRTAFDPQWVREAQADYLEGNEDVSESESR